MTAEPQRLIHSFGRRRGRKLRQGRSAVLDALLPQLSIAAPQPGVTLDPTTLFPRAVKDVWLEIGFGGGEHLFAQADVHREIGLIGAEPYINGVSSLLTQIQARGLDNIRLWADDIRLLLPALPPASIARAFILFPDPWPKLRHHKRRLIGAAFLDTVARVLMPDAELRVATDDMDYLEAILATLTSHPRFAWMARCADDWRSRGEDWPPTRYEAKALAAGRKPVYLRFRHVAKGR